MNDNNSTNFLGELSTPNKYELSNPVLSSNQELLRFDKYEQELHEKDEIIRNLKRDLDTSESIEQYESVLLAEEEIELSELKKQVGYLTSIVSSKDLELETLRSQLDLHAKSTSRERELQAEIDRLSVALNNEINLNQERKVKIRSFVENLTAEKNAVEEKLVSSELKINELNNLLSPSKKGLKPFLFKKKINSNFKTNFF
jgi:hypothetical protein